MVPEALNMYTYCHVLLQEWVPFTYTALKGVPWALRLRMYTDLGKGTLNTHCSKRDALGPGHVHWSRKGYPLTYTALKRGIDILNIPCSRKGCPKLSPFYMYVHRVDSIQVVPGMGPVYLQAAAKGHFSEMFQWRVTFCQRWSGEGSPFVNLYSRCQLDILRLLMPSSTKFGV